MVLRLGPLHGFLPHLTSVLSLLIQKFFVVFFFFPIVLALPSIPNAWVEWPWDMKIFWHRNRRPKFQCLATVWFPQSWPKLLTWVYQPKGRHHVTTVSAAFIIHSSSQPWKASWPTRWLRNKSNLFFIWEDLKYFEICSWGEVLLILLFHMTYLPDSNSHKLNLAENY